MKGFDKIAAMESHGAKKMLTMDLQKCLPTPYLTNGQSFYYRKLWTFNFTIMDSVPKESWCFMWDETVARRGGNEMASGIVKFFEQLNDRALKEVTVRSDNCAGQNKNIYLMMAYLWILSQKENIEVIKPQILIKGPHSHGSGRCSLYNRKREKENARVFNRDSLGLATVYKELFKELQN